MYVGRLSIKLQFHELILIVMLYHSLFFNTTSNLNRDDLVAFFGNSFEMHFVWSQILIQTIGMHKSYV